LNGGHSGLAKIQAIPVDVILNLTMELPLDWKMIGDEDE
jgi:hypothetical protein